MERAPIYKGAAFLVAIFTGAGLALATFLFGLDLWVSILYSLTFTAAVMKAKNAGVAILAGLVALGMAFSFFLWGFFVWPSALLGVVSIVIIATHLTSTDGEQTGSGDRNPIIYIAMIVAIRAFLATVYTSVSALTDTSPGILTWLTIFVVGIVPDFPVLVNVLLFVVLNGTLLTYLFLLFKRTTNPVAN